MIDFSEYSIDDYDKQKLERYYNTGSYLVFIDDENNKPFGVNAIGAMNFEGVYADTANIGNKFQMTSRFQYLRVEVVENCIAERMIWVKIIERLQ